MKWLGCLIAVLALSLTPQEAEAQTSTWSTNTAVPIPAGRWEFGILQPLHWGATDEIELSAHLLGAMVLPHLEAKILWRERYPFYIATRHRLRYPSLLLRLLSREGAGGILPATTEVPHAVMIDTEIVATLAMDCTHWATLTAGFTLAPRGAGELPLVDFPLAYPRLAALDSFATLHTSAGLEGEIFRGVAYSLEATLWWIPGVRRGYALEHSASLGWRSGDRWSILAGYRMSQARYPAGTQRHIFPFADLLFGF
jgi:hypothetical protein